MGILLVTCLSLLKLLSFLTENKTKFGFSSHFRGINKYTEIEKSSLKSKFWNWIYKLFKDKTPQSSKIATRNKCN